jgi:mono/diheme cytochrome c family protein
MRYNGLAPLGEQPADTFPFEISKADLLRGQQRFNIYCSVCHGVDGDGNGMIVQRGFTRPPSLHEQRLKDAPAGHFFNVITNGWGAMYSYNDRIYPEDRWRIIAYVRTLQLSQGDAVASAAGAAGQPQSGAAGTAVEAHAAPAGDDAVRGAADQVKRAAEAATEQQNQGSQPQPETPPTTGGDAPPQQPGAQQ